VSLRWRSPIELITFSNFLQGKIKAIIDTVYPFEDMVLGHIKMMESQLFGKLITNPQKL
jgi:NADPH:quinone reductase-like Zn-dependent oxidoreductase